MQTGAQTTSSLRDLPPVVKVASMSLVDTHFVRRGMGVLQRERERYAKVPTSSRGGKSERERERVSE